MESEKCIDLLSIFENNSFVCPVFFSHCLQQLGKSGPCYSMMAGSGSPVSLTFQKNLTFLFWDNFIFTKKLQR